MCVSIAHKITAPVYARLSSYMLHMLLHETSEVSLVHEASALHEASQQEQTDPAGSGGAKLAQSMTQI